MTPICRRLDKKWGCIFAHPQKEPSLGNHQAPCQNLPAGDFFFFCRKALSEASQKLLCCLRVIARVLKI
jgi:hypothetical protein